MRSIVLKSFSAIKQKKLQSVLIFLIIAASALLLSTSLYILTGLDKPFDTMFNKLNASHYLFPINTKIYDAEAIKNFFNNHNDVQSTTPLLPSYEIMGSIRYKGKKLVSGFILTEKLNSKQDMVLILSGEEKDTPEFGEIWIPNSIAESYKIKIDDYIEIPTNRGMKSLKVTAIVVDPQFSSGGVNPVRTWIAPGYLPFLINVSELAEVYLGVRLKSLDVFDKVWKEFNTFINQSFIGFNFNYEIISFSYLFFYRLIGTFFLVFSFLVILVSLFRIYSSIVSLIKSEYKSIGILKTIGFTPRQIIFVYLLQFLVIGTGASIPGITGGFFLGKLLLSFLMKSLGIVNLDVYTIYIFLFSFILILVSIIGATLLAARSAAKVKASEAIRYGKGEQNISKKYFIPLESFKGPIYFFLAIRSLFLSKRKSLLTFLSISFIFIVIFFALNVLNSLHKSGDNIKVWGLPVSDLSIKRENMRFALKHERLMNILKSNLSIKGIVPYTWTMGSTFSPTREKVVTLVGTAYDEDLDIIEFENINGRNPQKKYEISVAVNTAKEFGVDLGDIFILHLLGLKREFIITGIYQAANNLGQGFRIRSDVLKDIDPTYEPDTYEIILKPGIDKILVYKELEQKYGEAVDVTISDETFKEYIKGIGSLITLAFSLFCFIFCIVIVFYIVNGTIISIRESYKNFGILKTLGYTPGQLKMTELIKNSILTLCSFITGFGVSFFITPVLIILAFKPMGVVHFPVKIEVVTILLIGMAIELLVIVSTWISGNEVMKINPRRLIVE